MTLMHRRRQADGPTSVRVVLLRPRDDRARPSRLGLDGFRFYFLGPRRRARRRRVGCGAERLRLLPPDAARLACGTRPRQVVPPREAARQHLECAHTSTAVASSSTIDGSRRLRRRRRRGDRAPSTAGRWRCSPVCAPQPVPDDAPAAAMHQAMVMREMRGSAHLAAIAARRADDASLPTPSSGPTDVELFGWKDDPPVVTDERRGPATPRPKSDDERGMLAPFVRRCSTTQGSRARRRYRRHARRAQGLDRASVAYERDDDVGRRRSSRRSSPGAQIARDAAACRC